MWSVPPFCLYSPDVLVVISHPDHTLALQQRFQADPAVVVFADSDSLQALDTILAGRPKIVALNTTFAMTARGAALVARLKGDADLTGIDVRVLIEDEHKVPLSLSHPAPSSETMLIETSRPLGRAGTRAALRYLMDRRTILVNGDRGLLIDLSATGAQVLVPMRLRPNEPIRVLLPDNTGEMRCSGAVVWSVAVPIGGAIEYRAGVKFTKADPKKLEDYSTRFGGRPDLTFGAE
jgi:hypothetical protein